VPTSLVYDPLFGVAVTVLAYTAALGLSRRLKWLHPLFVTSAGLIALLLLADIPYEAYKIGGDHLAFFLGPATVALGVPLYRQAALIRRRLAAMFAGITVGCVSAMASAAGLVWLMGGTRELLISMMPKAATTPISVEIARQLGGQPELTAVLTVATGLIGSMIGPELLRLAGIREDVPMGAAVGTAAHGIGTARLVRESELAGGVSGFSMGAAGIVTALLAIPLDLWLF
jgi:predicted murein hydrolase (TIGR00659 family)